MRGRGLFYRKVPSLAAFHSPNNRFFLAIISSTREM